MTDELQEQLDRLNDAQREAADAVEGALLVIAGPGTGKTQLLSLRAANILASRDIQPKNILCLTYTNAGAEAMKKRLVELIGRDAYGIEVCTFHGFCSGLRSRYPERFDDGVKNELVSSIHQSELLNGLLKALPPSSPIFAGNRDGVNAQLKSVERFIGRFKRSGLTSDEFRAIQKQTLSFLEYAEGTDLLTLVSRDMPKSASGKDEFCTSFENAVETTVGRAPRELTMPVIATPGISVPYGIWMRDLVRSTALIDEDGKVSGYQNIRDVLFSGTNKNGRVFKEKSVCEKALAVIDVYDAYRQKLQDEGLYDFDDMIGEALEVMQTDDDLRDELQERYRYIQIDEFQDTNGAQMRIVELLTQGVNAPNVMAVGDDDQAIMRFQGASIDCIRQFQDRYHPKSIVLKVNYRSTPAIVELGKQIASQIEKRLPASEVGKDIEAFHTENEQAGFQTAVFESRDLEYYGIARDIRARMDAGFIECCDDPDEAIAVISPKHNCLKALIPFLHHFGIPFSYTYTSEISQMESMQTFLALMRYVVCMSQGRKERAAAQLPQIISSPELGLSREEIIGFALSAKRLHHRDWIAALTAVSAGRIGRLNRWLVALSARASSAPVRSLMFEMSRPSARHYQERGKEDPFALAEFNAGIRALLRFCDNELSCGRALGRAMRLADVVKQLDLAQLYGQPIDASIAVGKSGAVRLTSAHGSKGLEFDLVYLLDSDDETWHSENSSTSFFPSNMLIGDEKDDDDARRLLFVAVTRAKRLLKICRAGNTTVRELQGLVSDDRRSAEPDLLPDVIETSWTARFALDTPELMSLLEPDLSTISLSASALNDFVEYREGCINSAEFPGKRMMRLPEEPSIILEFGTTVHEFFENYVNHVVKAGDCTLDDLAGTYRQKILWLDYPREEVQTYASRFDRIVEAFVPWLSTHLQGRLATEVAVEAVVGDGVPLIGFCDLLMIDDHEKEIRIVDYKTGFNYPDQTPSTSYARQLQFYKLLLESSAEYAGYRVVESADLYVEPEKGGEGALHDPIKESASDSEIAHLSALIDAVWHRIKTGDFDTSAFESSAQAAQAMALNVKRDGKPKKNREHRLFQPAYEDWLIEHG